MTGALIFLGGMMLGATLILLVGAVLAASRTEDDFQLRLEREANRKYIETLERELIRKELGDL